MDLTLGRLSGVLDGRKVDIACLVEEGAMPGAARAGARSAREGARSAREGARSAREGARSARRIAGPIDVALEGERRAGCALALLIAAGDAGRFDAQRFAVLPATEAACMSRMPAPWPGEPAWVEAADPFQAVPGLRPALVGDLAAIAAIHEAMIRDQRLRIARDRADWEAILAIGESDPSRRDPHDTLVWVIESGGVVAAYLVLRESPGSLRWREHGTMPGAADLAATLFWSALAWSRRRSLPRLEGWLLPPEVTARPLYPVARRTRSAPVLLLRPLDPALASLSLTREEECRIWELDLF